MRVLHITNYLASGGAEKLLADMLPLLNTEKDIEADLLILTDKNNVFEQALIAKGVNVFCIKHRNLYDIRNISEIKKYIVDGGYDIVHSHLFPAQYWVALSRLFLGNKKVKFITTEHSTHNRRREKFYFRYIDKFIYSKYDSIISITEKTRDNLINWINPKRKKIDKHIVIENGVDIEKFKVALPYKKNELIEGVNENTKLICMVGRFSEAKDQPTLIRAVSKLSRDIHLVLVGEGPLMDDNKKLAEILGVPDRVHFLGFRQDIPRILKTVDIVVLSSHWEGFGLAAVEGMAAGKPVLVSGVEGLVEVVDRAGIVFETRNDESLYLEIKKLLVSKSYSELKAKTCSERSAIYDLSCVLNQLEELYTHLGNTSKWDEKS